MSARIRSLVLLATALLAFSGCGKTSDEWKKVTKELGEAWDAAKEWGVAKRDEAQAFFGEKMDDMSKTFVSLKQQAAERGEQISAATSEQWASVEKAYDAMKQATGEQWTKARDAFVAAYEAFNETLK